MRLSQKYSNEFRFEEDNDDVRPEPQVQGEYQNQPQGEKSWKDTALGWANWGFDKTKKAANYTIETVTDPDFKENVKAGTFKVYEKTCDVVFLAI